MKVKRLVFAFVLVLLCQIIPPAMAVTREPYASSHSFDVVDPGKQWVAGGILHVKDSYWFGSYDGTLGQGDWEVWFEQLSLNLATGEGTFTGKWRVTIPGEGTLTGNGRGKITEFAFVSGTFTGTHGTGNLEGVKKMGSFDGVTDGAHMEMNAWGTIFYP